MVAKVITVAPVGFSGSIVEVESDTSRSLPSVQIVGLGNKAIEEAKERVRSAITNSLLDFPKNKITINLAPAELPKDGAHYDLPIALSILCVSGQLRQHELSEAVFAGELALDGSIRPIKGAINIVQVGKELGFKKFYIPASNAEQASLIADVDIYGVESLKQIFLHLKNELNIDKYSKNTVKDTELNFISHPFLDDIIGQDRAKRALIIAAAGHHNILFTGTPGSGKTMLAKTLANLLPALTPEEQIAATKIHSLAGKVCGEAICKRPFRSPHHTASIISLIGGGNAPKPGEISLAHTGVLFLDELPEYQRAFLEALRQPLEDKKVDISRASSHVSYPADFMLVATMNPCPCGYYGDSQKECTCTSSQIIAYQKKLSGPLMDRIDMIINVPRVPIKNLLTENSLNNKQHLTALGLINNALTMQNERYNGRNLYNASLTNDMIKEFAPLSPAAKSLLLTATERLSLSTRSYFKIIKVARTIADLDGKQQVEVEHISEAVQFRQQS